MTNDKKIAVHCPTEDDWKRVAKKMSKELGSAISNYWDVYESDICLTPDYQSSGWGYASRGFYRAKDYTILSASDYLAYGLEGRGFKEGDRVESIEGIYKGEEGVVKFVDHEGDCQVLFDNGKSNCKYSERLKLISKLPPTHTVPLRVDDRVRVVSDTVYKHREGETGKVVDLLDPNPNLTKIKFEDTVELSMDTDTLELIPTEADITVGSVWEALGTNRWIKGDTRTVRSLLNNGRILSKEIQKATNNYDLLRYFKLIHRGDGEMVFGKHSHFDGVNDYQSVTITPQHLDAELIITTKTNKKGEKKMKTKTITEGLPIIDKACDNLGVVVYYDHESGEVAYKEPSGKHCFGHIDNIQLAPVQVVMPEPKPVKKKTTKKKGK